MLNVEKKQSMGVALFGAMVIAASGACAGDKLVQYQKIAITGDVAPGMSGAVFSEPFPPAAQQGGFTHDGFIAFRAGASGGDVIGGDNDQGIWAGRPGELSLIAREADQAPGTVPGVTFRSVAGAGQWPFEQVRASTGGHVAFLAQLAGPGVDSQNDRGFWRNSPDNGTTLLARENAQAPGLPAGVQFNRFDLSSQNQFFRMTPLGDVLFLTTLKGDGVNSSNDSAVYYESSGSLELLLRTGGDAPVPNHSFSSLNLSAPLINDHGVVAFAADIVNNDSGATSRAVFTGAPGGLNPVVFTGDPAPGTGGLVFGGVNISDFNNNGSFVMRNFLTEPGSTAIASRSLWRHTESSGLQLIAKQGDHLPGLPEGAAFFTELNTASINNADQVAFVANLTGTGVTSSNNSGIWIGGPDGLTFVARAGDQIPGQDPGTTFWRFNSPDVVRPLINDLGQVAFQARATESGPDSIFAYDPQFGLLSVLAVGDEIELAPGDVRTVSNAILHMLPFMSGGPSNGISAGLNNDGEITIWASFTDGSRGFVQASIIPSPGPVAAFGFTALALLRRRR